MAPVKQFYRRRFRLIGVCVAGSLGDEASFILSQNRVVSSHGVVRLRQNPPHGGFLRFWRTESPAMPRNFWGWVRLIRYMAGTVIMLPPALTAIEQVAEHKWLGWLAVGVCQWIRQANSTRR